MKFLQEMDHRYVIVCGAVGALARGEEGSVPGQRRMRCGWQPAINPEEAEPGGSRREVGNRAIPGLLFLTVADAPRRGSPSRWKIPNGDQTSDWPISEDVAGGDVIRVLVSPGGTIKKDRAVPRTPETGTGHHQKLHRRPVGRSVVAGVKVKGRTRR